MTPPRSSALRQAIGLTLMLVLTLAGVGRGLAAASGASTVGDRDVTVAGLSFHICHAGGERGSPLGTPPARDCCEACALQAPLMAVDAPALDAPASAVHFIEPGHAVAWMPGIARPRTPRLSQGPPTA